MLRIATDGSADMPDGWESEFEIHIVPIRIRFGERTYLQGVDIDKTLFYQLVRENRVIPATSLPAPGQFREFYQKISQVGEKILSIHVGSKMSGTYSAACMAAQELRDRCTIAVFDSGAGSAALAFMCREARLMDRAGASLEEICARLENIRENLAVVFTIDSLEYARMSGRVSALQARITSMLQIKPIIGLKDGILDMVGMVRTRSRSIDRILDLIYGRFGDRKINVGVVHAADPVTAQVLVDRVSKLFHIQELILTELSIAVAANLGPHTVGLVAYPVEEEEYAR